MPKSRTRMMMVSLGMRMRPRMTWRWNQTRTRGLRRTQGPGTMSLIWPTTMKKVENVLTGNEETDLSHFNFFPESAPLMGIGDVAIVDDDHDLEDDESELIGEYRLKERAY